MTRETFDLELNRLEAELLGLGHQVKESLGEAVDALQQRDLKRSERIIVRDQLVNSKRYDLEMSCLRLIATQQPIAGDLRLISAVIAIASELERIHDYAKGISKISLLIGQDPLMKPLVDLPRMASKTQGMLHRAMIAFSRRDVAAARAIPLEDDEVDALYNQIYREVFTYILTDSKWLTQANYLMWAGHNLERSADRVSNICERVIFAATGMMVELDVDPTVEFPLANS